MILLTPNQKQSVNMTEEPIPKSTTFNDVVDRVCRDLPGGYTMAVHLELNSGHVSLDGPDGEEIEFPSNYECLLDQVNDALEHACELNGDFAAEGGE